MGDIDFYIRDQLLEAVEAASRRSGERQAIPPYESGVGQELLTRIVLATGNLSLTPVDEQAVHAVLQDNLTHFAVAPGMYAWDSLPFILDHLHIFTVSLHAWSLTKEALFSQGPQRLHITLSGRGGLRPATSSRASSASSSKRPSGDEGGSSSKSARSTDEKTEILELKRKLAVKDQQVAILSDIAARKQDEITSLKGKLKAAQQKARRAQSQNEAAVAQQRQEPSGQTGFELARTSGGQSDASQKKWEWLTPQGALALAIRRNLSNVATADIGPVLCDDVSRWTVTRSEVRAAACLMKDSHNFWEDWSADCCLQPEDSRSADAFSVTAISYRQDATNSAVWNRSKLCALELEASYIPPCSAEDLAKTTRHQLGREKGDCIVGLKRLYRLADVLPVQEGTGSATVAMTLKLLQSLGTPTIDKFATPTALSVPAAASAPSPPLRLPTLACRLRADAAYLV